MKVIKEFGFRCFVIVVMLSLAFVAWDMSRPVVLSESEILVEDVVECLVQPFSSVFDDTTQSVEQAAPSFNFIWNALLPIIIYIVSIGGFMYLLIEDLKLLKSFSRQNKAARFFWRLWIIILIVMALIPVFFGMQLLMKGFVLAVIATAVFLLAIAILYKLSYNKKK